MTFDEELKNLMKINGLFVNDKQIELFRTFYEMLIEANKKQNLTTITNRTDIIEKHFIDSLTIINNVSNGQKILDIGTGAGFPSIPLSIMNPTLKITMIDSVDKKVKFVNQVIDALKLRNCTCAHTTAEEYASKSHVEKFDMVVTRAVAPLNTLLEYSAQFPHIDGLVITYKGLGYQQEIDESLNAEKLLNLQLVDIQEFNISDKYARAILYFKKIGKTDKKYPRKLNKPRKQPL